MSTYNQRRKIIKFNKVTEQTETVASQVLKRNNWNVDKAVRFYYENLHMYSQPKKKVGDQNKLNKIFDSYCNSDDKNECDDENLKNLCSKLGLNIETIDAFIFSYYLKASEQGVITRDEFVKKFSADGIETLTSMASKLDLTKKSILSNSDNFAKFYQWVFKFSKESEERKNLDKEEAISLWEVIFKDRWGFLKLWVNFISKKKTSIVTEDLWQQIYYFSRDIKEDLSNWEDLNQDAAWPSTIDEFVEYLEEHLKK